MWAKARAAASSVPSPPRTTTRSGLRRRLSRSTLSQSDCSAPACCALLPQPRSCAFARYAALSRSRTQLHPRSPSHARSSGRIVSSSCFCGLEIIQLKASRYPVYRSRPAHSATQPLTPTAPIRLISLAQRSSQTTTNGSPVGACCLPVQTPVYTDFNRSKVVTKAVRGIEPTARLSQFPWSYLFAAIAAPGHQRNLCASVLSSARRSGRAAGTPSCLPCRGWASR